MRQTGELPNFELVIVSAVLKDPVSCAVLHGLANRWRSWRSCSCRMSPSSPIRRLWTASSPWEGHRRKQIQIHPCRGAPGRGDLDRTCVMHMPGPIATELDKGGPTIGGMASRDGLLEQRVAPMIAIPTSTQTGAVDGIERRGSASSGRSRPLCDRAWIVHVCQSVNTRTFMFCFGYVRIMAAS